MKRNGNKFTNRNGDNFGNRNGDLNKMKRGNNQFGNSKQVNYYNRIEKNMDMFGISMVGRTRRLDTKKFTVTIDVNSQKSQVGIIRIFMGPRINNKQQLDDSRQNFVEIDQFLVKMNQGQNVIKRNSVDFKNVVGEPETMETLYKRAMNLINKKNGNDMNLINFDTINNNLGFPHRLVLPKGTVGGEDYTFFVVISDLKNRHDEIQYRNNLNTFNNNRRDINGQDSSESNSSSGSDSNSSSGSDSNESLGRGDRMDRNGDRMNRMNGKNWDNKRDGDRMDLNGNKMYKKRDMDTNRDSGRGNWEKTNGLLIHNFNNGNKNCGNGNGVLDTRAMGFPLDRQIIDVNGFITRNMFFKDVTVYHVDNFKNDDY